MGLLDDMNAAPKPGGWAHKDPAGWEQGYEVGPNGGHLCIRKDDDVEPDDWGYILTNLGLDPERYTVAEDSVEVRSWDMNVGGGTIERAYYFKARIRLRSHMVTDKDMEALCKRASRLKSASPRAATGEGRALVVALADWQIGKGEGGGTEATVDRIAVCLDQALERAKAEKPDSIVLAGLGDLAEGCNGWYPHQLYEIDLDEREQMRVATRLLLSAVDRFLGWPITLTSCVSNHGEKRDDGKHRTSITDNRDLQLLDRVGDVLGANPERYHDVKLVGPHEADPTVTRFDVEGVRVATTHGHVGMGGKDASVAVDKWLTGQIKGQRPAQDVELLLTGHRHHFAAAEFGLTRSWYQAPAMDGGSIWFASANGIQSHSGMLSLMVGRGCGDRRVSAPVIHEP
ncbi:MAG: hypothetical protein HKN01_01495 [Acidimicrobiia bacterium]|nr:hypothetical protein [Acidimicrobiia bacterium]